MEFCPDDIGVRVTVKIDDGALDVIVFVVHLKSKRPMIDPEAVRASITSS